MQRSPSAWLATAPQVIRQVLLVPLLVEGEEVCRKTGDYRQTSYRGPGISRRLGMLTDLAKCVLTLLSSPAPDGGPRSQGLRAQQEWVSAAEGQPQTSLGVEGKISSHKHPTSQNAQMERGDRQHPQQPGGGIILALQRRQGGVIAWPRRT